VPTTVGTGQSVLRLSLSFLERTKLMRNYGKWIIIGLGYGFLGVALDYFFRKFFSYEQQLWTFFATVLVAMVIVFLLDKMRNSLKKTKKNGGPP
jgi:hypothetical protein